jgi:DNA-directed RNA polymerase subunit H (RpoH/RPB5)
MQKNYVSKKALKGKEREQRRRKEEEHQKKLRELRLKKDDLPQPTEIDPLKALRSFEAMKQKLRAVRIALYVC